MSDDNPKLFNFSKVDVSEVPRSSA